MTDGFAAGFVTFVLTALLLTWLGRALLGRGRSDKPASARTLRFALFLPAKLTLTLGAVYLCIGVMRLPPLEFVSGALVGLGIFSSLVLAWWYAGRHRPR